MTDKYFSKWFIIKNTSIVTAINLLTVLAAIVVDAVIVAFFGLGSQTDAFFVAYSIPFIISAVIQEQASKVLLPLFIHTRDLEGEKEGWRFLNSVLTLNTVILFAIAVIGSLLSPFLIPIQIPGFNEETISVAIKISMILFFVPLLQSQVAIMGIAANAFGQFFPIPLGRFLDHLIRLLLVVVLFKSTGIFSLAYGFVAGLVVQLLLMYFVLRSYGFRHAPNLSLKDPKLINAIKLSIYPMFGFGVSEGVQLFQNFLASYLAAGSLSALRYATRLIDSLSGILSGGIVTIILPMVSKTLAREDIHNTKEYVRRGIQLLLFVTVPVTAWLILANRDLVRLFFERIRFTPADTIVLSNIIVLMFPYIFLSRYLGLVEASFFGISDTRTPLSNMLFLSILYMGIATVLFFGLGVYSFPVARSLSYICSCIFISALFRKRFGSIGLRQLRGNVTKILVSTMSMSLFLLAGRYMVSRIHLLGIAQKIVALFLPVILGGIAFLGTAYWIGLLKQEHFQTDSSERRFAGRNGSEV